MLVNKDKAFGLNKDTGDFILKNNKILRYQSGDEIFFYTGLQMLNRNNLKNFSVKKFSFNKIWDFLILNDNLYGKTMKSYWYHVGDIQGLKIASRLDT